MKKKWTVEIEQNGGEYNGWVTFYADNVERGNNRGVLVVDGYEMEFDEIVISIEDDT